MRSRVCRAVIAAVSVLLINPATAATITDPNYAARCQVCHQRSADGLPGQFPRLRGRVDKIASTPQGRRYLILVLLNGVGGPMQVDGKRIVGFMPGFATLSDASIASLLNAIVAAGSAKSANFTAAEVLAVRREERMGSGRVAQLRAQLSAGGLIP
ncbi:MAG TPA: hypothetical protein VF523_00270 [Burkholderiales bacterium]|uniref:c-type cytochrome n=1 Tax=Sphingobium sp. TaxID=1912891 RepID=UPI002ED19DDA